MWLGANVVEKVSGELFEGSVAHHIFERAGLKIGVFGVCTQTTPSISYPGDGVLFSDPIEASKAGTYSNRMPTLMLITMVKRWPTSRLRERT